MADDRRAPSGALIRLLLKKGGGGQFNPCNFEMSLHPLRGGLTTRGFLNPPASGLKLTSKFQGLN